MNIPRFVAHNPRDQIRELFGAGEWNIRAIHHNCLGNHPREPLLTVIIKDIGNARVRRCIHNIGCTFALKHTTLRHAHVERAIIAERKPANGLIKLHRGHANIEHDTIQRSRCDRLRRNVIARICSTDVFHSGEFSLDQLQPAAIGRNHALPSSNRCGVTVQCDHTAIGCIKNGPRIPASAKGAVEKNTAVFGLQSRQNFSQQHRDMRRSRRWGDMIGRSTTGWSNVLAVATHVSRTPLNGG